MRDELRRVHRLLCARFVDEAAFQAALGAGRGDISTVARYLALPVLKRPVLSIYFDRDFYFASNPDVFERMDDPLLHFLTEGFAALRSPHPLIDLDYIVREDPATLGQPPDLGALLDLLEYDLAAPSPYFDPGWYAESLAHTGPPRGQLRHFLTAGLAAGRRPNRWLDPEWYAAQHDDVPKDRYGALRHFLLVGDAQGRAAGPTFDGKLYRRRYVDVADAGVPPLRHYLTNGRREGRQLPVERLAPLPGPAAPGAAVPVAAAMPIDPAQAAIDYAAMRRLLDEEQQVRKDAIVPTAPTLAATGGDGDLAGLAFPAVAAPILSILIPAYDEFAHTLGCLHAIVAAPPPVPYEVVLADDASPDPAMAGFATVPNLLHVRQPRNAGFVRNCNAAWARCRGDYVLLLNNDARVLPDAIGRLLAALEADTTLAAVGPKLVYPNGRLQEAGCFIRPNGEGAMVGLFGDPKEPGFCRDRDVTYCSGAALMLRRAPVGEVLFDEAFYPAYCEDADLCLRLIDAGWRVRYIADAVVVHYLSVSTNRQAPARKLRNIARNQQKLAERWGELLARLDRVRPIAFYLPQFHTTPENDFWWGAGFTEWTNVVRAQPSYAGHYQPHLPADLGFYDLRTADALARQASLARRYGIEGFCVYYYNFGSGSLLGAPLDVVRTNPTMPFHWCLCWANENWTKHWDGGSREILLEQSYDGATLDAIIGDAIAQAADPRYLRVNGRPLFLVYRPLRLPDPPAFAAATRAAFVRAGFPGVHLVYVESMEAVDKRLRPVDFGFDACVEFPPHGRAAPAEAAAEIIKPDWSGYRYDYPRTVLAFCGRESVPYTRYPAVFPSWDNTPRQPQNGTSFDGATPEAFRVFVEEKIEEVRQFLMGDERLLFVNAWNEWAEGAHLEPDTGFGHRWLEAMRDALDVKGWR
ncbi:MAG: glycoside hydrolase family 99-like domain-containing protein [Alphaproteobacteria bacterium]|nr:glycoside hydrolase family 99-like domain-containing protein [Alphaproteobacteria bacterium]